MPALEMSSQVFSIFSALIEERTGLHYRLSDLDLLRDKAEVRVLEAGFDSFLDYYYFLRYDPAGAAELDKLVEALVVGETYFFREFDQLRVLARQLIPERLAARPRVRVWSAACATGEEPLSLAMLLDEQGLLPKVELVASDISRRALDRAQAGRFGRRSVRNLPEPALAGRYLAAAEDGYQVSAELLRQVDFRQVNLVEREQVRLLGRFDFILCRNVLIYFRDDVARTVVDNLALALEPGGALLVSVSESLMRFGTRLSCEEHHGVFVYRKGA